MSRGRPAGAPWHPGGLTDLASRTTLAVGEGRWSREARLSISAVNACIDSTARFANFVMPVLADQLARGGRIDHIAHTIAAWAHYLATIPVARQPVDPEADRVRPLAQDALDDPVRFIEERVGFPSRAVHDTRLLGAFAHAHDSIARHGALGAVRELGR